MRSIKRLIQYGLGYFSFFHEQNLYYHNGKRFKDFYRSTRATEYFSLDQIRQYQTSKFLNIYQHAIERVPFYHRVYSQQGLSASSVQTLDDITRLPFTDKEMIRSQSELFKAQNYQEYDSFEGKTSGSTAEPFHFLLDSQANDLALALEWRHLNWAGCQFHSKTVIMEYPMGWEKGAVDTSKLYEFDATHKRLRINSVLLNDTTLEEIGRILTKFQPDHIRTYPSLAMLLGKYLKSNNILLRPKSIAVRSEKLYPDQRQFIEATFECPCYEYYSQWECTTFAADCDYHHLHTFFELGITEIIKDGKPCKEGEVGELVCTQLHNYSMPLIRYKTGDLGLIRFIDCPCGRNMPTLEIVGCRGRDLIGTPKGYFIVSSGLVLKLNQVKPVKQVQFYQEDLNHLEVRLVQNQTLNDSEITEMNDLISTYFIDSLAVSIKLVDEIPRTPAGKYHYVISKVPISF